MRAAIERPRPSPCKPHARGLGPKERVEDAEQIGRIDPWSLV